MSRSRVGHVSQSGKSKCMDPLSSKKADRGKRWRDLTLYLSAISGFFSICVVRFKRLMRFLGIYSGIIFISFLLVVFLVEDFAVKKIDENFRKNRNVLNITYYSPVKVISLNTYFIDRKLHKMMIY